MSMTVLRKYYIKEYLKLFGLVIIGLGLVFDLLDLVKKIDDLLKYNPPFLRLAEIGALYFPLYVQNLIPMAALVCALFTIGQAARRNELIAVMSAGGRTRRLFTPFIVTGALLSLAGFALGEAVVPAASATVQKVRTSIEKKERAPSLYRDGSVWIRGKDGSLVDLAFYIKDDDSFRDVTVYRPDKDELVEIVRAEKARYDPEKESWVLSGVKHYGLKDGTFYEEGTMNFPYLEAPGIFKESIREPFEMGYFELSRYLRRLKQAGFQNQKLEVDLNSKLSYPLISLFMVILGVSVAARRSLGGLLATALGLLISLLYWLAQTMAQSMGYAGVMPPVVAAWITPLLFGAIAVYLYRTMPE
jgi:lipopolysaccharide export system permease protein